MKQTQLRDKMRRCCWCQEDKPISEFHKKINIKNRYQSQCKTCRKEYHRDYWIKNKEKYALKNRLYSRKWKRKDRVKKITNERCKERYRENPMFKLRMIMSFHIRQVLKGKKGGVSWLKLLGYKPEDLKKHLELQFDDKMSWKNHGTYWHIDHIKPASAFNFTSPNDKEFKECWALNNLQPLEKIANLKKSNHYKTN